MQLVHSMQKVLVTGSPCGHAYEMNSDLLDTIEIESSQASNYNLMFSSNACFAVSENPLNYSGMREIHVRDFRFGFLPRELRYL